MALLPNPHTALINHTASLVAKDVREILERNTPKRKDFMTEQLEELQQEKKKIESAIKDTDSRIDSLKTYKKLKEGQLSLVTKAIDKMTESKRESVLGPAAVANDDMAR